MSNLLEIVPDQLFQNYTVSEIDQTQKKLHYAIERKKEELRAMVGERYRDLIQAADTIEDMGQTTNSTLEHINTMIVKCTSLHKDELKINRNKTVELNQSTTKPWYVVSVQVKLLLEIPDRIWRAIEEEDFVKATLLFLMARHVHTGLQLQFGSNPAKSGLQSLHQIVQQNWYSISNLNQTIIDVCKEKLQNLDIDVQKASACLVSIYLLDNQTMLELLNTLISLHSNTSLKSTLQFDISQILEGDVKAHIKQRVVNGVKIVLKTVLLVHACFIENGGGAVILKLKELYNKESKPLVQLVNFSDPPALKVLPPVIANYKLATNKEIQPLPKEDINKSVQDWSKWVKSYIHDNVQALLHNVTRVKMLHEIREEAFKIETPSHWASICSSLSIPDTHIWCDYFQPLLTYRVKTIIDNRWSKIYDMFKTQLLISLSKVSLDTETEKEWDINWFVWKDLIGDTVIESRKDVVKVMKALMKSMSLQDRGCTPNVENLCSSLDGELQKLLDDINMYLNRDRRKMSLAYEEEDELAQKFIDKNEIEMYLKDVADRNIQCMMQYIKACFEEPTLQSEEFQRKTTFIFSARVVLAIPALMPHLRKCYIPLNSSPLLPELDTDSVKRWRDICNVLKEEGICCWSKWVDMAMEKVVESTNGLPQEFSLEANLDYLMMQWDVIKIEEKDEEGNPIESTIKVPAGPSLKLQEFLYSAGILLDEVVPHTIPIETQTAFIEKLTDITLAHYQKVISESEKDINQRCALQILMDIRHITMLLVPRENRKAMEKSNEICEHLRQQIDPFDYNVFYPYIQTNLKRSVQRVQMILGSLVLHHGQVTGVIGSKPVTSGGCGDKAPSPLAPTQAPWYSLLPVPLPTAAQTAAQSGHDRPTKKRDQHAASPGKTKTDITDLMSSSLPINFASARSGAASFFNSMTSDWFSGS